MKNNTIPDYVVALNRLRAVLDPLPALNSPVAAAAQGCTCAGQPVLVGLGLVYDLTVQINFETGQTTFIQVFGLNVSCHGFFFLFFEAILRRFCISYDKLRDWLNGKNFTERL